MNIYTLKTKGSELLPFDFVLKVCANNNRLDLSMYDGSLLITKLKYQRALGWLTLKQNNVQRVFFASDDEILVLRNEKGK
jgi:hypothetical protein